MKAVKPRSYVPSLLFGLGVELDHIWFQPSRQLHVQS